MPIVDMTMTIDAGYAADQNIHAGTAKLALALLDDGTKTRNSLAIAEELGSLGAQLDTGSNVDTSYVTLSALKVNLDASLAVFSDVILNPAFPTEDFERERKLQLAAVQREKVTPMEMAMRVLPALIYGNGHAYANPFNGSGTEKSVAAITREDVIKFHQTWLKPNNAAAASGRRHDDGGTAPKDGEPVRRMAARRSAEKELVRRGAQRQAETVPDRSPRVAAKRSDGGARRTTVGEPRRDRF